MYARKTLLIMGTTVLSNLVGYVSWYVITNHVAKDYVGSVGAAISALGLASIVADLGFSSAHIKRISEGRDLGRCIGTYASIKLGLVAAMTAIVLMGAWAYENLYPYGGFGDRHDLQVLLIMLLWAILSNLSTVFVATYLGRQQVAKAQALLLTSAVVQAISTVIIVTRSDDVLLFASTWSIGAASSLALGFLLLGRVKLKLPTSDYIRSYTRYALPMMLVIGAAPLILYLDRFMIFMFYTEADVADYWNSQKFAALPEAVSASLTTVLFPAFSSMVSSGSIRMVSITTRRAERYLSMFIVPSTLLLASMATPFIVIVSDINYRASGIILAILMGWVLFKAMGKPFQAHFGGFNKPVYSMYLSLTFIPLNVILNLVFIPRSVFGVPMLGMGSAGAALASLIGAMIYYLLIRFLSYKLVRIGVNRSVLRHLVSAGIMACAVFLVQDQFYPIRRFYDIGIYALLGGCLYFGLLILMREFRKKDLLFIIDTLHVGKFASYIFKELKERD